MRTGSVYGSKCSSRSSSRIVDSNSHNDVLPNDSAIQKHGRAHPAYLGRSAFFGPAITPSCRKTLMSYTTI